MKEKIIHFILFYFFKIPLGISGYCIKSLENYVDKWRRKLEFEVGDHVFLRVSLSKGVNRFGLKNKLNPSCIGPFEILNSCWGGGIRISLAF